MTGAVASENQLWPPPLDFFNHPFFIRDIIDPSQHGTNPVCVQQAHMASAGRPTPLPASNVGQRKFANRNLSSLSKSVAARALGKSIPAVLHVVYAMSPYIIGSMLGIARSLGLLPMAIFANRTFVYRKPVVDRMQYR